MTFWGRCTGLAAAVVATACLNDPAAPAAYRLEVRPDTIRFVALHDTLRPIVLEHHGSTGPSPLFIGTYHILDTTIATVSATGLITSRGAGLTRLLVRSPYGASDTAVVLVSQSVAGLHVLRDTITLGALDAQQPLEVVATDPLGSEIESVRLHYDVQDTAIATVTDSAAVRARGNGITTVTITGNDQSAAIIVRVAQRVTQISIALDTLRFTSLGETQQLLAQPLDSLGHPVTEVSTSVTVSDTNILAVVGSSMRSKRPGMAHVLMAAGGLSSDAVALVSQAPARIAVAFTDTQSIHSVFQDSLVAVSCRVLDGNGYDIPVIPAVAPSSAGRWSGSACDDLRARVSGFDTLRVSFDSVEAAVPVVLAVRPLASSIGDVVIGGESSWIGDPWAPSADTASNGAIELYLGNYVYDSTTGDNRSNLERLLSSDGLHFQHDSLMLPHGDDINTGDGRGVENAVTFPAADGSGWRMLYAGGNETSGWSVYGAQSTDRRGWTKTGPVIGNGYPNPVRPAGEGLVVDRLADGTWRLLMGAYEPSPSVTNTFSITEWHSADQVNWSFVRSLISANDLPLPGVRVVYSPVVRQVGPSLWRMAFTADNFSGGAFIGGQSNIWTAVSTDFQHWQIEGILVSLPGANVMYSAMARDRLYFVRRGSDGVNHLATAVVQMP